MRRIPLLASIAVLTGAPAMSQDSNHVVYLDVRETTDSVELLVMGKAEAAADARFVLEVESGGTGGTTRTSQSGVHRSGGAGGTLLRSNIRTSGLGRWTARLRVETNTGNYTETRSNASS